MTPFRPAAVAFDMDGLLFDTETLYAKALLAEAARHDLHHIDVKVAHSTIGMSWEATRSLLASLLPENTDPDRFMAGWRLHYDELADAQLPLKAGVVELLDFLGAQRIPCAVVSNSSHPTIAHHLGAHGLRERFSAVVSGHDCEHGKPEPDPYLEAASRLGQAPGECLALEDSRNGCLSACSAGMRTIMVPDLVEPDADLMAQCSAVVDSLFDVRDMLAEWLR